MTVTAAFAFSKLYGEAAAVHIQDEKNASVMEIKIRHWHVSAI